MPITHFFSRLESEIPFDKPGAGRYRPLVKTGTQYSFPNLSSRPMANPNRLSGPEDEANNEESPA
jgi:hypothetical protein